MEEGTFNLFSSTRKKSGNSNFLYLPVGIQKYVSNKFNAGNVN